MSIAESGREELSAADTGLKAFLSYSRKDIARAERLRGELVAAGFDAYLDKHDILPGEDWHARLAGLIETADAVLFLISPDSVTSSICDWEVNEAERLSKRILPIVIRDAASDTVPGRLTRLNYIFLRDEHEEVEGLAKLRSALLTDIGWVREHTRIGELAANWERGQRASDLTLRGSALSGAELWVSSRHPIDQAPTDLHRAFIISSRESETARLDQERVQLERTRQFQKRAAWGLGGIAALLLVGAGIGAITYRETSVREARVFTSKAREAYDKGELPLALRFAVAGLPATGALPLDYWSPALEGLLGDIAGRFTPMLKEMPGPRIGYSAGIVVDQINNRALVTGSDQAVLWDTLDGRVVRGLPWTSEADVFFGKGNRALVSDGATIRILDSKSGQDIATHGGLSGFRLYADEAHTRVLARWTRLFDDKAVPPSPQVRVFALEDGRELPPIEIQKGFGAVVSPDGGRAALTTEQGRGYVFDLATGKPVISFTDPGHKVRAIKLSRDGRRGLAILDSDKQRSGQFFDAQNGQAISSINNLPTKENESELSVRPNDEYDISFDGEYAYRLYLTFEAMQDAPSIQVWNLRSGVEVVELRRSGCFEPHLTGYDAGQSHEARVVAICNGVELLNPKARAAATLGSEGFAAYPMIVSPRLDRIMVVFPDGYFLYDSVTGRRIINGPASYTIYSPVFSPDGAYVYGQLQEHSKDYSTDITRASLRDAVTGKVIAELAPVEAVTANRRKIQVDQAVFSERGTWLATRHGGAVVLHDGRTGREVSRIWPDPQGKPGVKALYFAGAKEDRLITEHQDGSVRLWDISGQSEQGRQLVDAVCRQKLLGPQQKFTETEMQDPILAGQVAMQAPCSRLGPLTWPWWLDKIGLSAKGP